MSLLSLPDWIGVVQAALAARPHPDAIATDTPETAKAVERARLEYAAKLLVVLTGVIWLAGRLFDAMEATLARFADLAGRVGADDAGWRQMLANVAAARPVRAGPADPDSILPTATAQNLSAAVLTLLVLTLATRLLVRGTTWRVAMGAALTVTLATQLWSLMAMWVAIQAIRRLPMLGTFFAGMERLLANDASAAPEVRAAMAPAMAQLVLPIVFVGCVILAVAVISQYRTFRALGMQRRTALFAAPLLILLLGAIQHVASALGLRAFVATLVVV